ncbi:HK97 family phage prohead protease, partial [Staphylococcus epidermidis]
MPAYKDTSVEVGQRARDLKKFKQLEQMKIALDLESLRFET